MLNVIDLGLRLEDVREMGLKSEVVPYRRRKDPRVNLRESGATVNECDCSVQAGGAWRGRWNGERVQLNAMTCDQFIDWPERKLEAAGVSTAQPPLGTKQFGGLRHFATCPQRRQKQQRTQRRWVAIPEGQEMPQKRWRP